MNVAAWFGGAGWRAERRSAPSEVVSGVEQFTQRFAASASAPVAERSQQAGRELEPSNEGAMWVVLTGEAVDREVVDLACVTALAKGAAAVHAIYCIEVPRAKAIDAEVPMQRRRADEVLRQVAAIAARYELAVETECVRTRSSEECAVRVVAQPDCAAVFVGTPYRTEGDDVAHLSETVDDLLRRAPCPVYVIRGEAPSRE